MSLSERARPMGVSLSDGHGKFQPQGHEGPRIGAHAAAEHALY